VLRAAGETDITQENTQDWLELDEGDPRFQLLTEDEIAAVIFLFIFISTTCIISYGVGDGGIGVRVPVGLTIISTSSRPASGPNQPPNQWIPGDETAGA
jgi:hypothetical protein